MIDFKGNCDNHFPLIEFSYNNTYYLSISIAPFEALHCRRCRSLVGCLEMGESSLIGSKIVYDALEKVCVIRNRLKTTHSQQKSYVDNRRRDHQFNIGDEAYLSISPMKWVMRFG